MSKNIIVFGASSTWGAWDREMGGWVNRLRLYLDNRKNPSDKILLYNFSISGATSSDLLKRIEVELQATSPKIVVLSLGLNDSAYWANKKSHAIPLRKFIKNLEKIYQEAKKYTDDIICVGPQNVTEKITSPVAWDKNVIYKNEYIKTYQQAFQRFSQDNKLIFIELFGLLENNDLEDGLHPNTKGHEKIFEKVKNDLIKNKLIN